jgi:hypothetical protein
MGLSKDELRKMTVEELIKFTKGNSSSSSSSSSAKSSSLAHESSSMNKYF